MKYRFFTLILIFLFWFSFFSFNVGAIDNDDFHVGVFGSSLLTGLRQQGGVISNYNQDESVYNISFTFSIIGIYDESINYVFSNFIDELEPNQALLFSEMFVSGFGPIIISLNASSSNAGDTEESIKGFQIGLFTISKPYVLAWI
jgi:hypothetical protein